MKFNAKASVLAVFAAAAFLTGCGESQTPEQKRAASEAVINQLEQKDRELFKKAGFEIVTRSGTGVCGDEGDIRRPADYGAATDISYILKKSGNDNITYTACVVHTSAGGSSIRGLKAVDRFITPGAPQQ